MAFTFSSNTNGENYNVTQVLPAASEQFECGEALVFTGGKVTKAGAAVKPQYTAARSGKPAAAGDLFPVYQVVDTHIYQTFMAAGQTAPAVGDKCTLSADGLYVMAAAGGSFEVREVETLVNGEIRVVGRFV